MMYELTISAKRAKSVVVMTERLTTNVGAAYQRRYEVDGDRLLLGCANPDEHWRVWERVK